MIVFEFCLIFLSKSILSFQVRPGDVASQESVRKALGIGNVPKDNSTEQGKYVVNSSFCTRM